MRRATIRMRALIVSVLCVVLGLIVTVASAAFQLPDSLQSIADEAYMDCDGLVELEIPNGTGRIGARAFAGCDQLRSLRVPTSVTEFGEDAFSACPRLALVVDKGGAAEAYCAANGLYFLYPDTVVSAPEDFAYELRVTGGETYAAITGYRGSACDVLQIPEKIGGYPVRVIGRSAFSYPHHLKCKVRFPEGLTTIEAGAFSTGLDFLYGELQLPQSLTTIEEWAFYSCAGFTGSLTIPENVVAIGEYAFDDCTGFTGGLTLPGNLTSIGEYAFSGCGGFTGDLVLPNKLTSLGRWAFSGCGGFTGNLVLPPKLTVIKEGTFNECGGFTGGLTLPNGVVSVEYWAFRQCGGFSGGLTLPDGLQTIGESAFFACHGFTGSLALPDTVTTIAEDAFCGCSGFTGSLTLPKGLTSIGHGAFFNCRGFTGSLTLPKGLTSIGHGAFSGCHGFTGSLTLPEGLLSVADRSFSDCSGFTGSLTLPEGLTSVGDAAFQGCNGLSPYAVIPASVVSIGDLALADTRITTIYGEPGSAAESRFQCYYGYSFVAELPPTLLTGAVYSNAYTPVDQALVTLRDVRRDQTYEVATDRYGKWEFPGVQSRVYEISVGKEGYRAFAPVRVLAANSRTCVPAFDGQPTAAAVVTKLDDPVITYPAEGEEISLTEGVAFLWEAVPGAGHYVLSLRDLDTDELLEHHLPCNEGMSRFVHACRFVAGHRYRLAIGAVPPDMDSTSEFVGWGERLFSIAEAPAPTTVFIAGTVLDGDKLPLAGVAVSATLDSGAEQPAAGELIPEAATVTAGDGAWTLGPLSPNAVYIVRFAKESYDIATESLSCSTGAARYDVGVQYAVRAGETTSVFAEYAAGEFVTGEKGLFAEYFQYSDANNAFTSENKRGEGRSAGTFDYAWTNAPITGNAVQYSRVEEKSANGSSAHINFLAKDKMAIRWNGWYLAPATGEYRFRLRGDDGSKLTLIAGDKEYSKTKWSDAGAFGDVKTEEISLYMQRGTEAHIRIEYYNATGTARLAFEYAFRVGAQDAWSGWDSVGGDSLASCRPGDRTVWMCELPELQVIRLNEQMGKAQMNVATWLNMEHWAGDSFAYTAALLDNDSQLANEWSQSFVDEVLLDWAKKGTQALFKALFNSAQAPEIIGKETYNSIRAYIEATTDATLEEYDGATIAGDPVNAYRYLRKACKASAAPTLQTAIAKAASETSGLLKKWLEYTGIIDETSSLIIGTLTSVYKSIKGLYDFAVKGLQLAQRDTDMCRAYFTLLYRENADDPRRAGEAFSLAVEQSMLWAANIGSESIFGHTYAPEYLTKISDDDVESWYYAGMTDAVSGRTAGRARYEQTIYWSLLYNTISYAVSSYNPLK